MSILETFYILFKSDASEVKKGSDEAEQSTRHLQESLQNVGKESDKIGHSFRLAAQSIVGLFAGFASVHSILSGFHNAVNEVSTLGDISRALNVNVESLDAWGKAVQRTGGSAASFQSSLTNLANHFGTTNEMALRLLPRLSDAFSKFNQLQANTYGKSLGLDQATIYLLQQGRREVEATIKRQKEQGLVTKEQVEITRKYDNALYDAKRSYQTFYRELSIPLLPGFTKAINFLLEHKDLIVGAFVAIGGASAILAAPFITANSAVLLVTGSLVALGAAFALIFDDIRTFQKGGESVTGYINKQLDKISEKTKSFGERLPHWAQVLTGFNALKPGSNTTAASLSNPFSGFSLDRSFFNKITGHNALASTQNINIGDVTINTQATDAQEISYDFTRNIKEQLLKLNGQVDNGVMA